MKRVMLLLVLAFMLVEITPVLAAGKTGPVDEATKTSILAVTQRGLELEYLPFVGKPMPADAQLLEVVTPSFLATLKQRMTVQGQAREALVAEHIVYGDVATTVTLRDLNTSGRSAIATVSEHVTFVVAEAPVPDAAPTTESEEVVTVHLVRDASGWKLTNVIRPVGESPSAARQAGEPLVDGTDAMQGSRPPAEQGLSGSADIVAMDSTLSRPNIVNYARTFVYAPNTNYRDFYYTGGDCTNFASQALRNGNWWDVSGSSGWWYSWTSGQSTSWINATSFYSFTRSRPRGYIAQYFSQLQAGDILQADWDRNGTIDHTMVVTYSSNGYILLTYRNGYPYANRKDYPLSSVLNANPNAWYYGWRLYNTVY